MRHSIPQVVLHLVPNYRRDPRREIKSVIEATEITGGKIPSAVITYQNF
jgi:hypothetical protein